jgi:hypothetical protein
MGEILRCLFFYEPSIRRTLTVEVSGSYYGEILGVSNLWDPHQHFVNFLDGGNTKMFDTSQYYPILLNTSKYYKCTVKNLILMDRKKTSTESSSQEETQQLPPSSPCSLILECIGRWPSLARFQIRIIHSHVNFASKVPSIKIGVFYESQYACSTGWKKTHM